MSLAYLRNAMPAVLVTAVGLAGVSASSASAATVEIFDGTVVFSAAPGEVNNVRSGAFSGAGSNLTIIDSAATVAAGAGCEQIDAHTARCPEDEIGPARPLIVWARDGNDRLIP